jgi:hypothetical protein
VIRRPYDLTGTVVPPCPDHTIRPLTLITVDAAAGTVIVPLVRGGAVTSMLNVPCC